MKMKFAFVLFGAVVLGSSCGGGNNPMTVVDRGENGFALYRSGQPEPEALKQWCDAGVKTVFALNGRANEYKEALEKACPGVKIIYDVAQDPGNAVDRTFLELFDQELSRAKAAGYGVLFHCSCGCHRTGRLAAYYRMKYNAWTPERAIEEMNDIGRDMDNHPSLPAQVNALYDFLQERTCTQPASSCVK